MAAFTNNVNHYLLLCPKGFQLNKHERSLENVSEKDQILFAWVPFRLYWHCVDDLFLRVKLSFVCSSAIDTMITVGWKIVLHLHQLMRRDHRMSWWRRKRRLCVSSDSLSTLAAAAATTRLVCPLQLQLINLWRLVVLFVANPMHACLFLLRLWFWS